MIFIDSNAFIAIRNKRHPLHGKAIRISSQIIEPLVCTNIVIAETLTILSMRVNKSIAIQFGKEIKQQNIQIVHIDEIYQEKAWNIFQKIKSKDVSFFDCTSFAVMESFNIKKVFSFDEDFKKYGFEPLDM